MRKPKVGRATLLRRIRKLKDELDTAEMRIKRAEWLEKTYDELRLQNMRLRNAAVLLNKYQSEQAQVAIEQRKIERQLSG